MEIRHLIGTKGVCAHTRGAQIYFAQQLLKVKAKATLKRLLSGNRYRQTRKVSPLNE